MFSMRLVSTDHRQVQPTPGLDVCFSDFRDADVYKVPVLILFGVTPTGQKTCMHVHGVFPYLYVPYDGGQLTDKALHQFAISVDKALNIAMGHPASKSQHVYRIVLVSGIPFYGYQEQEEVFMKVYLYNPLMVKKVADLLLGGAVLNKIYQPYESHIPYSLQMLMDYNLYGMNLVHTAAVKFRKAPSADVSALSDPASPCLDESIVTGTVWDKHNIPPEMWLEDVARESTCELEVDVVAADILNRLEIGDSVGGNPGLAALWDDERQRHKDRLDDSNITPPDSPDRGSIPWSDAEAELQQRYQDILHKLTPFMSVPNTPPLDASPGTRSPAPLSQDIEWLSGSPDTVIMEDGEGEAVVCERSIHHVVSSSQSFSQPGAVPDRIMAGSQDESLVQLLASMAEDNYSLSPSPHLSQAASLILAAEDQDSILSTQRLSGQRSSGQTGHHSDDEDEVEVDGSLGEHNLAGMDQSWNSSAWEGVAETEKGAETGGEESSGDEDSQWIIPQLDGPADKKGIGVPQKKRLGIGGPTKIQPLQGFSFNMTGAKSTANFTQVKIPSAQPKEMTKVIEKQKQSRTPKPPGVATVKMDFGKMEAKPVASPRKASAARPKSPATQSVKMDFGSTTFVAVSDQVNKPGKLKFRKPLVGLHKDSPSKHDNVFSSIQGMGAELLSADRKEKMDVEPDQGVVPHEIHVEIIGDGNSVIQGIEIVQGDESGAIEGEIVAVGPVDGGEVAEEGEKDAEGAHVAADAEEKVKEDGEEDDEAPGSLWNTEIIPEPEDAPASDGSKESGSEEETENSEESSYDSEDDEEPAGSKSPGYASGGGYQSSASERGGFGQRRAFIVRRRRSSDSSLSSSEDEGPSLNVKLRVGEHVRTYGPKKASQETHAMTQSGDVPISCEKVEDDKPFEELIESISDTKPSAVASASHGNSSKLGKLRELKKSTEIAKESTSTDRPVVDDASSSKMQIDPPSEPQPKIERKSRQRKKTSKAQVAEESSVEEGVPVGDEAPVLISSFSISRSSGPKPRTGHSPEERDFKFTGTITKGKQVSGEGKSVPIVKEACQSQNHTPEPQNKATLIKPSKKIRKSNKANETNAPMVTKHAQPQTDEMGDLERLLSGDITRIIHIKVCDPKPEKDTQPPASLHKHPAVTRNKLSLKKNLPLASQSVKPSGPILKAQNRDVVALKDEAKERSPSPPVLEREDVVPTTRKPFMSGRQAKLQERAPPLLSMEGEVKKKSSSKTSKVKGQGSPSKTKDTKTTKQRPMPSMSKVEKVRVSKQLPSPSSKICEEKTIVPKQRLTSKPCPRSHKKGYTSPPYSPKKSRNVPTTSFSYHVRIPHYQDGLRFFDNQNTKTVSSDEKIEKKGSEQQADQACVEVPKKDLLEYDDLEMLCKERLLLLKLGKQDIDELVTQIQREMVHKRTEHIMPLVMNLTPDEIETVYKDTRAKLDPDDEDYGSSYIDSDMPYDSEDEVCDEEDQKKDQVEEKALDESSKSEVTGTAAAKATDGECDEDAESGRGLPGAPCPDNGCMSVENEEDDVITIIIESAEPRDTATPLVGDDAMKLEDQPPLPSTCAMEESTTEAGKKDDNTQLLSLPVVEASSQDVPPKSGDPDNQEDAVEASSIDTDCCKGDSGCGDVEMSSELQQDEKFSPTHPPAIPEEDVPIKKTDLQECPANASVETTPSDCQALGSHTMTGMLKSKQKLQHDYSTSIPTSKSEQKPSQNSREPSRPSSASMDTPVKGDMPEVDFSVLENTMDTDSDLVNIIGCDSHMQLHTPPIAIDSAAETGSDENGDKLDTPAFPSTSEYSNRLDSYEGGKQEGDSNSKRSLSPAGEGDKTDLSSKRHAGDKPQEKSECSPCKSSSVNISCQDKDVKERDSKRDTPHKSPGHDSSSDKDSKTQKDNRIHKDKYRHGSSSHHSSRHRDRSPRSKESSHKSHCDKGDQSSRRRHSSDKSRHDKDRHRSHSNAASDKSHHDKERCSSHSKEAKAKSPHDKDSHSSHSKEACDKSPHHKDDNSPRKKDGRDQIQSEKVSSDRRGHDKEGRSSKSDKSRRDKNDRSPRDKSRTEERSSHRHEGSSKNKDRRASHDQRHHEKGERSPRSKEGDHKLRHDRGDRHRSRSHREDGHKSKSPKDKGSSDHDGGKRHHSSSHRERPHHNQNRSSKSDESRRHGSTSQGSRQHSKMDGPQSIPEISPITVMTTNEKGEPHGQRNAISTEGDNVKSMEAVREGSCTGSVGTDMIEVAERVDGLHANHCCEGSSIDAGDGEVRLADIPLPPGAPVATINSMSHGSAGAYPHGLSMTKSKSKPGVLFHGVRSLRVRLTPVVHNKRRTSDSDSDDELCSGRKQRKLASDVPGENEVDVLWEAQKERLAELHSDGGPATAGSSLNVSDDSSQDGDAHLLKGKKKPVSYHKRLSTAFVKPSKRGRRKVDQSKLLSTLSVLHQATLEKLDEADPAMPLMDYAYHAEMDNDYEPQCEDVMFKMALLSPPPSEDGDKSPPHPVSPTAEASNAANKSGCQSPLKSSSGRLGQLMQSSFEGSDDRGSRRSSLGDSALPSPASSHSSHPDHSISNLPASPSLLRESTSSPYSVKTEIIRLGVSARSGAPGIDHAKRLCASPGEKSIPAVSLESPHSPPHFTHNQEDSPPDVNDNVPSVQSPASVAANVLTEVANNQVCPSPENDTPVTSTDRIHSLSHETSQSNDQISTITQESGSHLEVAQGVLESRQTKESPVAVENEMDDICVLQSPSQQLLPKAILHRTPVSHDVLNQLVTAGQYDVPSYESTKRTAESSTNDSKSKYKQLIDGEITPMTAPDGVCCEASMMSDEEDTGEVERFVSEPRSPSPVTSPTRPISPDPNTNPRTESPNAAPAVIPLNIKDPHIQQKVEKARRAKLYKFLNKSKDNEEESGNLPVVKKPAAEISSVYGSAAGDRWETESSEAVPGSDDQGSDRPCPSTSNYNISSKADDDIPHYYTGSHNSHTATKGYASQQTGYDSHHSSQQKGQYPQQPPQQPDWPQYDTRDKQTCDQSYPLDFSASSSKKQTYDPSHSAELFSSYDHYSTSQSIHQYDGNGDPHSHHHTPTANRPPSATATQEAYYTGHHYHGEGSNQASGGDPAEDKGWHCGGNSRHDGAVILPGIAPPEHDEVERDTSLVQYTEAYCSRPEDVPDKPRQIGGRIIKVQSSLVKDLPLFESGCQASRWRQVCVQKQLEGFAPSQDMVAEVCSVPSLYLAVSGQGEIPVVMTPCSEPPSFHEVHQWLQKISASEKSSCQEKHKMSSGLQAVKSDLVSKKGYVGKGKGIGKGQSKRNCQVTATEGSYILESPEGHGGSVKLKDKMSEESRFNEKSNKGKGAIDAELVKATPVRRRSMRSSTERSIPASPACHSLTQHRRASDLQLEVPDNYSPSSLFSSHSQYDEESPKSSRRPSITSSTPSRTPSAPSVPVTPAFTPISCNPGRRKSSTDRNTPFETPSSSQRPGKIRRRLSTSTENSLRRVLLSSQIKHQMKSPSMNKAGVSQIEGPTPKNSFGFKVSQQSTQDSKALHQFQYLTVMSMELHVRTRGDLSPDPEFDCICALFFAIHNDIPPEKGKRDHLGLIVLNKASARVPPTADQPSTSKADFTGINDNTRRPLLERSGVVGLDVKYVNSEEELIDNFTEIIGKWDPDMVVGYELQQKSWGYLVQRAAHIGIHLVPKLSRTPESCRPQQYGKDPDSYGAEGVAEVQFPGRTVLNLWRIIRHEVTLNIYSYENVVYHVLHQRVPHYTYQTLTEWYDHRTDLYRSRTIDYYVGRVKGNLQIIEQLDIIGKTSEFARVFGIEFYHVLSRGTQYRVESMMLRVAKPMNYIPISPSVQQRARMRAPECIPLTMEPRSGLYTHPVVVVDFQSLYPSIMIAYNYCFSTCLGRLSHLEKANEGPFDFGCTSLNVPPTLLKKLENDITVCPNGVVFVRQHIRKGVISAMVEEILKTRLMVKQSMKEYKDDKTLQRLLHARQLGLKLIANVTFGYTAANFSGRMPCVEVGDSIVTKARETLERAIHLVEDTPKWGAKVIYGDTDSMFILLEGRSKDEAFRIGEEIAAAVTADNPKPIKLKFEKVYLPCVLQTKKRYMGFMYETPGQKEPKFDAKGTETVRRDTCSAVSKILERSIKLLFTSHDISQVKTYVQRQCIKIMEGKASVQDCVFAREFRGMAGYKPGVCIPALEITRKLLAHDRRAEPLPGERVPYVIVCGTPGLPLIQLVRRPGELVNDPSLRINAPYYITKQILPPLARIFTLLGVDVFGWYNDLPRIYRVVPQSYHSSATKKGTISQYFSSLNCPVCDATTKQGLCNKCKSDPQQTTTILNSRIQSFERSYARLKQICTSCQGFVENEEACISLDCPNMFRRIRALRDTAQIPDLLMLQNKLLPVLEQ